MLKAKWTRAALQDVDDAVDHISKDNFNAAIRVAQKIYKACKLLQEMPSLGREGRFPDLREWVVSGIRYTIWYSVNEKTQTLEIVRVLHDSRKRPTSI
jgi:addiction module RelE/StbE family toxin